MLPGVHSGERERETATHTLTREQMLSILHNLSPYTILYDSKGELCVCGVPSGCGVDVPISTVREECEKMEEAVCRYRSGYRLRGGEEHTRERDENDAVYALGLIMYECTSGQNAFDGYSTARLRQLVPLGMKPDMESISSIVSPLISSCLSADPHTHPLTLSSLIHQLSLLITTPSPSDT